MKNKLFILTLFTTIITSSASSQSTDLCEVYSVVFHHIFKKDKIATNTFYISDSTVNYQGTAAPYKNMLRILDLNEFYNLNIKHQKFNLKKNKIARCENYFSDIRVINREKATFEINFSNPVFVNSDELKIAYVYMEYYGKLDSAGLFAILFYKNNSWIVNTYVYDWFS